MAFLVETNTSGTLNFSRAGSNLVVDVYKGASKKHERNFIKIATVDLNTGLIYFKSAVGKTVLLNNNDVATLAFKIDEYIDIWNKENGPVLTDSVTAVP